MFGKPWKYSTKPTTKNQHFSLPFLFSVYIRTTDLKGQSREILVIVVFASNISLFDSKP
jgi:hypothetical protein